MKTRPRLLLISLCAAAACQVNKGGTNSNPLPPPDPAVTPPPPFEPLPPRAYAAKVKDLLTGLALQDDELPAVTADPRALRRLIDSWMGTARSSASKMIEFFKQAFQQTQLDVADLDEQLRLDSAGVNRGRPAAACSRSVEESFARTVLALVDEGRPFTETVTTTRFMLNVPLMVALAYMDAAPQRRPGPRRCRPASGC